MPTPTPDSYSFTPGTPLYAGMATPGGSLLTTLTLANTSGSTQAANFVSPMFGLPLKQGDVPSGEYPAFELTDGTPCQATIFNTTSWPDGSMKFCAALIRVPTTVAGSGSLTINVKNGGSAPGASSRTTSDLTAADLAVELTGVTNLTGTWTASLNTAITDAADIVEIGDGPAGRIWRIGGPFKQSGSAHGQLHCWHYVAALQDSSGGLLGLRYLGRAALPWCDVASPTPTRLVVSAAFKSGATTLRSLQGHDTTETPGSNIGMAHYTSFYTAGTDGKWDFVQGGGSASADCTVRVQHDKTYFVKSRLVPPYDLTLSPTSSTSVDYYPYGRAGMTRYMGTTGERADIGVLPSWMVRHLLTQSATDERVIRAVGLCAGGWRVSARRSSTNQIVATSDVSATYTGLGTVQPTWRGPVENVSGFQAAVSNTSLWSGESNTDHRPSASYYPYLVTGEPQYIDQLVEVAATTISQLVAGSRTMNMTPPVTVSTQKLTSAFGERDVIISGVTYKGGGYFFKSDLLRLAAWGARDLAQAGAMYPDTCPWGTETRKYIREFLEASRTALNVYNAAFGEPWASSGIVCFNTSTEGNTPWCSGYFSNSVCHQASILPTTEGNTLRARAAKHWADIASVADIATAVSYLGNTYDENNERVSSSADMLFYLPSTLTFSTSTNRFTVGGTYGTWSPTDGDVIACDTLPTDQFNNDKPFTEATDRRRLYVVNASGNTGQLALTPGGTPITVTFDGPIIGIWARIQNLSPLIAGNDSGYTRNIYGCIRHHAAAGDSSVSSLATTVASRLAALAYSYASDPKDAIVETYPS